MQEELACGLEWPDLGHLDAALARGVSVVVSVARDVGEHVLEAAVLADELERGLGPDAPDRVEVVAAKQQAEIGELLHGHVESVERGLERDLGDRELLLLARGEVLEQDRRAKREGIHVLRSRRVHAPLACELGALRLGLARRGEPRDAHEREQALHLGVVLARGAHLAARELVHELRVGNVLSLLLLLARLLAAAKALLEHVLLEVRRLPVEHVRGLDAAVDHADRAVEEAEQVARDLARLGHHLLPVRLAHRDEELVQAHGRVDRDLAPEERLDVRVLDRARRLVGDDRSEAWGQHARAASRRSLIYL